MNKLKINGEKLRELIQIKFETQTAFADELGVTYASVTRWINGSQTPARTIYRICDILDCEIEDLKGNKND